MLILLGYVNAVWYFLLGLIADKNLKLRGDGSSSIAESRGRDGIEPPTRGFSIKEITDENP